MKQIIKNIIFVSYLKNKGIRRICFILGVLLALLPTIAFFEAFYISENYDNLRDAVVYASEYQQKYVFQNYKYSCNKCDAEIDFEVWKRTFADWELSRSFLHHNCLKQKESVEICQNIQKYLSQKVSINYFNFTAFRYLEYSFLLFYLPFFFACTIKWVISGFKQSSKALKKHKI